MFSAADYVRISACARSRSAHSFVYKARGGSFTFADQSAFAQTFLQDAEPHDQMPQFVPSDEQIDTSLPI